MRRLQSLHHLLRLLLLFFSVVSAILPGVSADKNKQKTPPTITPTQIISTQFSFRAAFQQIRQPLYPRFAVNNASVSRSASHLSGRHATSFLTTSPLLFQPQNLPRKNYFYDTRLPFFSSIASTTRHYPPVTRLFLSSSSSSNSSPHHRTINHHQPPEQRSSYHTTTPINMPRGVKKENLPSKVCVTCERPFVWRKKWEKVWDEVTTCSKSCNHKRRRGAGLVGMANKSKKEQQTAATTTQEGEEDLDQRNRSDDNSDNGSAQSSTSQSVSDDMAAESFAALLALVGQDRSSPINHNGEAHMHEDAIQSMVAALHHQEEEEDDNEMDPEARRKAERKAAKKAKKAERREQRQGRGDPSAGQKDCDMCSKSVDLLIRCMYEEGQTDWKMVCGKCWKVASGGVVDGDKNHPHYRYGGLWKNRRAQK
jgi:hypothetical protein